MKVFGIAGFSGSGKTTLVRRLIPELVALGVRVGAVKHTHHQPALDAETQGMLAAGAAEVAVASPPRWALAHEVGANGAWDLERLLTCLRGVDLVLVEGFKTGRHPKLEVHDPFLGKPLLCREDSSVVALACDHPLGDLPVPRLRRDAVAAIARLAMDRAMDVTGQG